MSSPMSTAVTYNFRCARSLLTTLRSFQKRFNFSPNSILLFALAPSSTTPPEVLSEIVSTLIQLYPEHVGCISASLPYPYFGSRKPSGPHSCSLAYAFVNGVSFRSTISGRVEAQVGRWYAARQRTEDANGATRANFEDRILNELSRSDGKVNWDDVWVRTANSVTCSSSSRHGIDMDSETFPNALRNLDPSAVDTMLYFSDRAPERIATMLEAAFPQANKLSLIASSTPFVTGRPVTLFHNGSVLSKGVVGIAFNTSPSSPPPVVELSFPPLVALSTNLNVTSSEGNLILSLDSRNPTQLLLSAIQRHCLSSHTTRVAKENEFYVGVIDPSSQQVFQLHRINAGDPSRGTIALDISSAPREGSIVRLYHLPRDPVPDALADIPDTIPNSISLFVAPEVTQVAYSGDEIADGLAADSDCTVISDAFLAASENGFTLSHGAQGPWKCNVTGGRVGLSWGCPKSK